MIFQLREVQAALPHLTIGETLGRGGAGVVLAARDRRSGEHLAVKILLAAGGEDTARFRSEATFLTRLRHPHVVAVRDLVEGDGFAGIVMELLAGGSLRGRLPAESMEAACLVAVTIAEALYFAHTNGVLHRDIKPANILFAADGTLKVSDFGIARALETSAISPSAVIGTPQYMAPE